MWTSWGAYPANIAFEEGVGITGLEVRYERPETLEARFDGGVLRLKDASTQVENIASTLHRAERPNSPGTSPHVSLVLRHPRMHSLGRANFSLSWRDYVLEGWWQVGPVEGVEARSRGGAAGGQAVDVPDLAALYVEHRDAMYRVAYATLRPWDMQDSAPDAVSDAIVSIMKNGLPAQVNNWQAFLVNAAKRRAQDIAKSAAVRHAGPTLGADHDRAIDSDLAEDTAEEVDRQRQVTVLRACLGILDDRQRLVAVKYIGQERPRAEIAAELGVTPARISQIKVEVLKLLTDEMTRREDER